jgi:hypothetical protein
VSARSAVRIRSLVALACAAVVLAGCGKTTRPASVENNGVYVDAGPVTYQLQISRELNQYSTEDAQYVNGLPAGTTPPSPSQLWYGVFLWAKNQTKSPHMTSDNIDIVDTDGNHYYPISLNHAANPYAWTAEQLGPGAIEPGPDTTASFGPTQGGLLLFKLNSSAYDNRPLLLEIRGPGNQLWATISLDL